MAHKLPHVDVLRKVLRYEPDTGHLFWLNRSPEDFTSMRYYKAFQTRHAGKRAGSLTTTSNSRYWQINLSGTVILAHRAAWALYYGEAPKFHIDHINGDGTDNRIENLRDVSASHNLRNQTLNAKNTSGICGVWWHKGAQKWACEIKVNRKKIHLGLFDNLQDAARARAEAQNIHDFLPGHGKSRKARARAEAMVNAGVEV